MPTDVLSQTIDPPLGPDESATVDITATTLLVDPSAWTVEFALWRDPEEEPLIVELDAPVVTGPSGDLYTAVWTVFITAAQAADQPPGLNTWTLRRTDAGDEERLAGGSWLVLAN